MRIATNTEDRSNIYLLTDSGLVGAHDGRMCAAITYIVRLDRWLGDVSAALRRACVELSGKH